MLSRLTCLGLSLVALVLVGADKHDSITADKKALGKLQTYVGQWKGVGQPKRGSNQGAWTEQAEWAWQFDDSHAALMAKITDGKYFSTLRIEPGETAGQFTLLAKPMDGSAEQSFAGALDADGQLVLTASQSAADRPGRISIRLVADGDRMLILYERRSGKDYSRLAEVGSTRKGSQFAKGSGYPECVVTGGRGTIAVQYDGKEYFVCCTGCRDLFRDDPVGVLAEYGQRKAKERAEAKK